MANFRPIIVMLLLLGLMVMGLITYGIQLADDNEASVSIGDDPAISSYSNAISTNLTQASADASSSEDSISNSAITLTSAIPFYDSITGIWKTVKSVPTTIWNLTIGLVIAKIFGSQQFSIALDIIGALLTITIVFAVWKFVSTGESG